MSMFPSTLPMDTPDSRPTGVQAGAWSSGAPAGRPDPGTPMHTALSSLSPSLMQDLLRFDEDNPRRELLEVLAAGVRHTQPLAIGLAWGRQSLALSVFPTQRLVHCPMDMEALVERHLPDLRVMHIEPAVLQPPGHTDPALIASESEHHPLAPLLWELAMRGQRTELLPEIAGPAIYRLSPGLDVDSLPARGAVLAAMLRLRREPTNLPDLARWPGLDRERATRLLNALYLQAGLIISRSHPDAAGDSWFRGRR